MNKTIMNGIDFYNSFKSGAEAVKNNKEILNKINVFPVRDGDTGTNLAITMNSIVDEATVSTDFDIVIKSMSDSAFDNARGNSGIIFAGFINGFNNACGHLKTLSIEQFSLGVSRGVKEAYASVAVPVEGTMLSVIRAWSEYINMNHKKHQTFGELLSEAYESALKALEDTPNVLEILKKNKVVDSGAKGFVTFLEGFTKLVSEFIHPHVDADEMVQGVEPVYAMPLQRELHHHDDHEHLKYRYCTEVLLHESIAKKDQVEKLIAGLGDSEIVTGNERRLKIHIHTDKPDLITKKLIENGYKINKSKVDDMQLQTEVEASPKARIAILTDSIADLSEDQILREQVHVMALSLIADDCIYLDKLTATKDNIETILEYSQVYPTSAQLEIKQIKYKLESLMQIYEEVIIISVAKALSGTHASFEAAVAELSEYSGRIHLIDSKLNSGAQGLMVLEAVKMANRGEVAQKIIQSIEKEIPLTDIYVSLDTFKYAVKSGRVPNRIGKILMKLNAKPIMALNREGFGTAFGLAFSRKSIDQKILKHVRKISEEEGIDRYAIVHAGNLALAESYQRKLEEMLGKSPEIVTQISAITTIHAGIGAVAVAIVRRSSS